MFEKPLNRGWRRSPLEHPDLKARLGSLDLLGAAFLASTGVYAFLIASGLLPGGESPLNLGLPIEWLFTALAAVEVPMIFLVGSLLLSQASVEPGPIAAFEKGRIAMIVALALAESVALFGLVAFLLGASIVTAYALIAAGAFLILVCIALFRPRIVEIVIRKLEAEGAE